MGTKPHKWKQREKKYNLDQHRSSYSEILLGILARRKLDDEENIESFLNPSIADLHDPALLPNIGPATERLKKAVETNQKIIIFGD